MDATPASPRHYTLAFDHPQRISWLGLTLKPGYAESVDVYVSEDGQYRVDPVYSATDVTSTANRIDWIQIPQVEVRYVRLVLTQSAYAAMRSELALAH